MDQRCTVDLDVREADMIAKVLLLARRGNLGYVAYSPVELSRVRRKIMDAFGLTRCEPDPAVGTGWPVGSQRTIAGLTLLPPEH